MNKEKEKPLYIYINSMKVNWANGKIILHESIEKMLGWKNSLIDLLIDYDCQQGHQRIYRSDHEKLRKNPPVCVVFSVTHDYDDIHNLEKIRDLYKYLRRKYPEIPVFFIGHDDYKLEKMIKRWKNCVYINHRIDIQSLIQIIKKNI